MKTNVALEVVTECCICVHYMDRQGKHFTLLLQHLTFPSAASSFVFPPTFLCIFVPECSLPALEGDNQHCSPRSSEGSLLISAVTPSHRPHPLPGFHLVLHANKYNVLTAPLP